MGIHYSIWSKYICGINVALVFDILYFGYTTVNSEWAEIEGIKATAEGYIAPIGFLILNSVLLYNMSDILYATTAAS